jgi:micrococcal nuclease
MRKTLTLLAVLVFVLAFLSGCGGEAGQERETAAPGPALESRPETAQGSVPESPDAASQDPPPDGADGPQSDISLLPAAVVRAVDGDTIHVRLSGGVEERVRFIGVDTPESTRKVEPYGKEAAAHTEKRLSGGTVYLEMDVAERDKYGRLLAYVWLSPPENDGEAEVRAKMFNAELLLQGYAQVMTVPPNVKYADLFAQFQREARENGRGLWGAAPQDPEAKGAFVGSVRSNKYHYPDCRWAERISPANEIWFDSAADARAQGYEPCGACRPPVT